MTERTANLHGAIAADVEAKQKARDEATAPEREAREKSLAADAALYGTAGWESLSSSRQALVSAWSAQQAQGGGDDAA
jgi:hypothetical protein